MTSRYNQTRSTLTTTTTTTTLRAPIIPTFFVRVRWGNVFAQACCSTEGDLDSVQGIIRRLLDKDPMRSLMDVNDRCSRRVLGLNIRPVDGAHTLIPRPSFENTRMAVCSWVWIQTQDGQPRGKCASLQ